MHPKQIVAGTEEVDRKMAIVVARGLVATLAQDEFSHRFGGGSWTIQIPDGASPPPTLILTLDLRDPAIRGLLPASELEHCDHELPLITRTDGSADRQDYSYDPATRTAVFSGHPWSPFCEAALPEVVSERAISLTPFGPEYLEREGSDDPFDTFLGGEAWLRVGGEPLWRTGPETATCRCGTSMFPLVWVGHESYAKRGGFLVDRAFFLGELALYFFVCLRCRRVTVVTQA